MKRFVLYPILFVLAYFFSRVNYVKGQIDLNQVIRPMVIAVIATVLFLAILSRIFKSVHRAGFILIFFAMVMFFYGPIYNCLATFIGTRSNFLSFFVLAILIGLFSLGCSPQVWEKISSPALLTYYLNIVFIIMFLFQCAQAPIDLFKVVSERWGNDKPLFSNQSSLNLTRDVRPDIYIIVLDAYARADVLKDIYQYDNTNFLTELEKRGFYIASQSSSNYVQTKQALSSFLNLDYISPLQPSDDSFSYYHSAIADNRVFSSLRQIGYKTIAFDSGFPSSSIPDADIYYTNFLSINEFESYLLWDTPIELLLNVFGSDIPTFSYQTHRERVLYTFQMLQKIPENPDPKIVFAHILSPHPPFIFDQNGKPIEPRWPYQIWDAGSFQGKKSDYLSGYRNQIEFVNDQILNMVDAILRKSKTPPVIILMGDHGPSSMFSGDMQNPGCLWERTSNFEALLLPGHLSNPRLYPSISPVNNIRLVFDLYFTANLPLLEDRTFLTNEAEPYVMKDITQQSQSTKSCFSKATPP